MVKGNNLFQFGDAYFGIVTSYPYIAEPVIRGSTLNQEFLQTPRRYSAMSNRPLQLYSIYLLNINSVHLIVLDCILKGRFETCIKIQTIVQCNVMLSRTDIIVGTIGCVFIDNETHQSGVTK